MMNPDVTPFLKPPFETSDGARKSYSIILLFPGHTLTDHLSHGDGLVAFGFISALARAGHRLHVITQRVSIKSDLPEHVTIYTVPPPSAHKMSERLNFLTRSRSIVARLIGEGKVDFVHQLNPVCNGMSLGLIGLKIPLILGTFVPHWPKDENAAINVGGWVRRLISGALLGCVLRLQESRAAAFILTTPAAMSRFSSEARVSERVYLLANGIDVAAFAPVPAAAGSETTILFLANVVRKKGIFTLLEAFKSVYERVPGAKLIIAGSGKDLPSVRSQVASLSYGYAISVIGRAERSAVPKLLANCGVYCLPSFSEPYGMTVIEAMSCGKPIVVTDSGGPRHLVDDCGGRRVQPENAAELADALVEILTSRELQARMSAHNRAIAEREYDWPQVIMKLEAIYASVIAQQAVK